MSPPRWYVVLALLWSTVSCAWAQVEFRYDTEAERQFIYAVSLFDQGRFDDAAHAFDSLSVKSPVHQRTTAAYLMYGKALLQLKQYDRSVAVLDNFLAIYSYTSYAADGRYILGLDYQMERRFAEAARSFISAMETANDPTLRRRIEESLITLSDRHLDSGTLSQLRRASTDDEVKDLLALKAAEKDVQKGDLAGARLLITERLKEKHEGKYRKALSELLSGEQQPVGLKIGVVLPLMSHAEENGISLLAKELLEGMTFAAGEYAASAPKVARLTLDVRDTEHDSVLTVRIVRQLSAAKDVVCIVGPLFSNLVGACTSIADRYHVPLISPTATGNGLTTASKYVFQTHPDFATRGKLLARYAVREKGYRTLSVLTSSEPVGAAVADAFSREAQRLGAQIVATEMFPRQTNDIREQCMAIRRSMLETTPVISFSKKFPRTEIDKLLKAGVPRRRIDSLMSAAGDIPATTLLGPQGVRIADSLRIRLSSPTTESENLNIPITSIDATFVGIDDAEEIGVIGSQLNYFNIKTQILGNNEWYDPDQLDAQKQYVNGVLFASDTFIDESDPLYADFLRSYRSTGGKQPTKYTVIGYDIVKLILAHVAGGKRSREELREALSALRDFKGLHSSVTLTNGRVNSTMHLLQYSKGDVRNLGEISLTE